MVWRLSSFKRTLTSILLPLSSLKVLTLSPASSGRNACPICPIERPASFAASRLMVTLTIDLGCLSVLSKSTKPLTFESFCINSLDKRCSSVKSLPLMDIIIGLRPPLTAMAAAATEVTLIPPTCCNCSRMARFKASSPRVRSSLGTNDTFTCTRLLPL